MMTKKEFENTTDPLCLIVSINISTGKVIWDTYAWNQQDLWMDVVRHDFPDMIHFSKLNKAGIKERKKLFGISV